MSGAGSSGSRRIATIATLASAALLAACHPEAGARAPYTVQPPKQYRGDAVAFVRFDSAPAVAVECAGHGAPSDSVGCTLPDARLVILPNPCTYQPSESYALLVCHELGHLNGWPATHPYN